MPSLVSSASSPMSLGIGGTLSSSDLAPTISSLIFGPPNDLKSEAARADGGVLSKGFGGDGGGSSE